MLLPNTLRVLPALMLKRRCEKFADALIPNKVNIKIEDLQFWIYN